MASIWSIGGTDLYVDTYRNSYDPTIAELNPINSTSSVFHYIFTPTEEIILEATVVGTSNKSAIEGDVGTAVTLITDLVPSGLSVLLSKVDFDRQLVSCQFIDTTQATTAPVYRATLTVRPQ